MGGCVQSKIINLYDSTQLPIDRIEEEMIF